MSTSDSPFDSARDSPAESSTPVTGDSKADTREAELLPTKGKKGKKSKKQQPIDRGLAPEVDEPENQQANSVSPETIPLPQSNDSDLDIDEFEPIWSDEEGTKLPLEPASHRREPVTKKSSTAEEAFAESRDVPEDSTRELEMEKEPESIEELPATSTTSKSGKEEIPAEEEAGEEQSKSDDRAVSVKESKKDKKKEKKKARDGMEEPVVEEYGGEGTQQILREMDIIEAQPVENFGEDKAQIPTKLSKTDKKKAKKAKKLQAVDDLEDSSSSTPIVQEAEYGLGGSLATRHPEASTSTKDLAEGSWSFGESVEEAATEHPDGTSKAREIDEPSRLEEAVVEEPAARPPISRKQSKKDKKAKKGKGLGEEQSSGQQTPMEPLGADIETAKDSQAKDIFAGGLVAATALAGSAALAHSMLGEKSKEVEPEDGWSGFTTKVKGKKGKKGKQGQTPLLEASTDAPKDISTTDSTQVFSADSETRPHHLEDSTIDSEGREIGEDSTKQEKIKDGENEDEGEQKSSFWGVVTGKKADKSKKSKGNGTGSEGKQANIDQDSIEAETPEKKQEQTAESIPTHPDNTNTDSQLASSPIPSSRSIGQEHSRSQLHNAPGAFIDEPSPTAHREAQENRDSAVHVSDSPTQEQETTPKGQPRDSGIHVLDTPASTGRRLSASTLPLVKDEDGLDSTSRDMPGSFDVEGNSSSTPKASGSPISMESRRLTGTSTSSADPLNISVEMDPSYEVAISRPYNRDDNDSDNDSNRSLEIRWKPEASTSDLGREENSLDDSREGLTPSQSMENIRQPSPVEPASKERSSALFNNSPPSQRGSRDINTSRDQSVPAHNEIPRSHPEVTSDPFANEDYTPKTRHGKDLFSPSPPSNEQMRTENRDRSLAALSGTSLDHEEPHKSIFGGPIGKRPDLYDSPSSPFSAAGSDKRRLNTIKEADSPTDESPLGRKGRSLPGDRPPQTLRHPSTSLQHSQGHLEPSSKDSNDPRSIKHDVQQAGKDRSAVLSTEDLMSRLSWPPVDEDQETVDLERRKSRERSGQSAGRQQNESPRGGNLGADLQERRAASGGSDGSNGSARRYITPDKDPFRPGSVLSNRSSGTPPLRRVDRSLSGDLRAASKRNEARLAREAEFANVPSTSSYDPATDKGKGRARDMADIYVSYLWIAIDAFDD